MQLSPPPVALSSEIRWVLRRAFGPPQEPFREPVDGRRVAELAGDLRLVERIGARVPSSLLVAELGAAVARDLALSRLQVLAGVRGLCELIPELASAAAAAALPIVLLKFAALYAGGYLAEGSRAAADIDILLPEREAPLAAELLTGRGFFAVETTATDHHHLPPLRDRLGRVVELHTRLPGLREPGASRFAGFEALERAGGLVPAPGLGRGCSLLRSDLMAAHAVAHGLAQHGGADVYPLTRVLADLIDVLPGDRRTRGIGAAEWITADVSRSQLEAVLGLCDALERGDMEALAAPPETRPESALLHEVLASALDPDYRRARALGSLFRPLSDEPRWWKSLKMVRSLALPTKAQLAVHLGLPSARLVNRRLRLAHAVALARRLPQHARAALRVAWRRVTGG